MDQYEANKVRLTFRKHCWRSRRPAHPAPAQHVDGPSLTPRGPTQTPKDEHGQDLLGDKLFHINTQLAALAFE